MTTVPWNSDRHIWNEHSTVGKKSRVASEYHFEQTLFDECYLVILNQFAETCGTSE
jgi:hypothetical protein